MEGLIRDLQALRRAVDDLPYSEQPAFVRTQHVLWCENLAKEITRAKPFLFWSPRGRFFSLTDVPRHLVDRGIRIDRAKVVTQDILPPYFALWDGSGERQERMFSHDLIDKMEKLFPASNQRQQQLTLEEISQKVFDVLGGNLLIPGLSEPERLALYTIAAKKITGLTFSNHHTEKTPHQNK